VIGREGDREEMIDEIDEREWSRRGLGRNQQSNDLSHENENENEYNLI
jgi:hypothetical protein